MTRGIKFLVGAFDGGENSVWFSVSCKVSEMPTRLVGRRRELYLVYQNSDFRRV
jgi:hypothetical protein